MRAGLEAEEAVYRRGRLECQEHVQQKRETARVENELKEAKASLQRARKEQRDAEAVVTAMEEVKVYSLEMLEKGKKMGRHSAESEGTSGSLAALAQGSRAVARADEPVGFFFKTHWDREMAEAHGEDWAELFAEMVQQVLDDLGEGRSNALSVFMHNETRRVLAEIPAFIVPGACHP